MIDPMSQVITGCHPKLAFFKLDLEASLCQSLQGLQEMNDVVFPSRRVNGQIVHVGTHLSMQISIINRWKVAGAPTSPNGITRNSYFSKSMEKAVFSLDAESMGTCQYPLAKLNVVINFADDIQSNKSSILGIGKGSGLVTSISLKGGTIPQTSEIWTHICGCHNFFPLSSVQIIIIPACCLLCVL